MDDSKVEISKSKINQLKNLIKSNCYSYYNDTLLPEDPWFIQEENESTVILKSILQESQNEVSKFSQKSAETILHHNQLDILYTLKFLKYQQEFKEISDLLSPAYRESDKSSAKFQVVTTRSTLGPIYIDVKINEKSERLDPNSQHSFKVSLEDKAQIKISANEGARLLTLDKFEVFFKELNKEEISFIKKPDIQKFFHRKGDEFEAKVCLNIELSHSDKRLIYEKRLGALEELMREENKSGVIYSKLIESLDVYHDIDTGQFKSLIKAQKTNRDSCCGRCSVF